MIANGMTFLFFFKAEPGQIAFILNSKLILHHGTYLTNPFQVFSIIQICLHLQNESLSSKRNEEKAQTAFRRNMEKPLNQNSF